MNILISLLYAPLVFLSLRYFDIKIVSILIFTISSIWFFFSMKKGIKEALYPLLYIIISVFSYFLEAFIVLKVLPLLLSTLITALIFVSYINKKSIILYFAKKFTKREIEKKEEEYIQKSTLFWGFISLINVLIHLQIFVESNIDFWIYYSSFGWYFLFLIAGIIQFLHRKFIFLGIDNA